MRGNLSMKVTEGQLTQLGVMAPVRSSATFAQKIFARRADKRRKSASANATSFSAVHTFPLYYIPLIFLLLFLCIFGCWFLMTAFCFGSVVFCLFKKSFCSKNKHLSILKHALFPLILLLKS